MSFRSSTKDAFRRGYFGITRGTLTKADDSKKMQEVTVESLSGEKYTNVEHWHPYGMTMVPKVPENKKEAEALLLFVNGSRSHPIVMGIADRRHRLKNMQEGEVALHDDQGQKVHLGRNNVTIQRGNVKVTLEDGKAIIEINGTKSIFTENRIDLGGEGGSAVQTVDGPSTKVFAKL
jgi:phage gp45-like